jgi:hypothetical protein
MTEITGGKVGYRRTVQPAPYESKTAECELSFSVEEGEDPETVAADVLAACRAAVEEILGLRRSK